MNCASSSGRSPANEAGNLSRSRNRKPSWGGRIGGAGAPGGGETGDKRADRLALVRGEGGDVDQRRDGGMGPCLADDRSAVGVAGQHGRPVLTLQDPPGDLGVAFQRQCRVLHDADVVAVLAQQLVKLPPAGAVDEAAVDEDDVSCCTHLFLQVRSVIGSEGDAMYGSRWLASAK
jgi:hypothetical protein